MNRFFTRIWLMALASAPVGALAPGVSAADVAGPPARTRAAAAADPALVPGLDDNRVQMVVASQDLTKTLEVLSEQTQLKFSISKGLKGTTSRLRIDGTGRAALDAVANQVGAVWWWNGSEVRLAPRSDIITKSLKARDIEYTVATARELGLPMNLLTISKPSGRQNVRVSGPSGLVSDFETLNEEISTRLSNVSLTKFGRRRLVKLD
jgi:type II secretory pathway component GspD/PulD (secretin)